MFPIGLNVSDDETAVEFVFGTYISHDAFRLLRTSPVLGRDFLPADDVDGAPGTAILSHDRPELRQTEPVPVVVPRFGPAVQSELAPRAPTPWTSRYARRAADTDGNGSSERVVPVALAELWAGAPAHQHTPKSSRG